MSQLNHNSTTTRALLMAPVVDLWITLMKVFKSKIFLSIVTGIGFLYTWTFSMLAFSEETSFTFLDYIGETSNNEVDAEVGES